MKNASLCVGKLKSEKYKVYAWGQPDYHISNRRGSNYRTVSIPGQPRRGFDSANLAFEWVRNKFKTQYDFKCFIDSCGDGTFMNDNRFYELDLRDVPGYLMT